MALVETAALGVPAEVLLASALIGEDELADVFDRAYGMRGRGDRLGTGVKSVDDVLDRGLSSGRVVGLWYEAGAGGGSELYRALLVNSLLKQPNSTAAVIDTTGNFDILRLYALILFQLRTKPESNASVRSAIGCQPEDKMEDVAAKLLDHIRIMRVFDFVGVREAINEIRDGLEEKVPNINVSEEGPKQTIIEEQRSKLLVQKDSEPKPKRTVVADSEDEDEGEDDDEMLFDALVTEPTNLEELPIDAPNIEPEDERAIDTSSSSKVNLILIDNLNHVLSPLLKKDYIKGNALASTFLRSLNHLTRTHDLHTILVNPATHPRAQSPTRKPDQSLNQPAPPLAPPQQTQPHPPSPSIFASNNIIPSLLSLLGKYVDLGLLVSQLPRRKMDAKVFYKDAEKRVPGTVKKLRGVEMVNVIEIMSDRSEGRVGAWGTFMESDGGIKDLL